MLPNTQEYLSERQAIARGKVAACNSPSCAGCYEVADGMRIHPPKMGEDYRAWNERWSRASAEKKLENLELTPQPQKKRKKR